MAIDGNKKKDLLEQLMMANASQLPPQKTEEEIIREMVQQNVAKKAAAPFGASIKDIIKAKKSASEMPDLKALEGQALIDALMAQPAPAQKQEKKVNPKAERPLVVMLE